MLCGGWARGVAPQRRLLPGIVAALFAAQARGLASGILDRLDPTRFTARFDEDATSAVPLTVVRKSRFEEWVKEQSPATQQWLVALGRGKHRSGQVTAIPGAEGTIDRVLFTIGDSDFDDLWAYGDLPKTLPPGSFSLDIVDTGKDGKGCIEKVKQNICLSWALGSYKYDALRKPVKAKPEAMLCWPVDGEARKDVERAAKAVYLCRDLITTPCEDCGPADLAEAAMALFAGYEGTTAKALVGEELLEQNFPQIHAVGRAGAAGREPRLVDLTWGDPNAPKVTLVGKGVCFDTGGLNIKPGNAMLTMKKDMGGAAHVIALAAMIMDKGLGLRLRVLLPIVENNIDGGAFRPGDVLRSRNGKTTEIGNTDAEGRLILADALVLAAEEKPELVIDMATLTGASRVALGADVPSVFSNDDALARELQDLSATVPDQVWQLPLWKGYRPQLKSSIADLKNIGTGPYGGAITAAIYLQQFIKFETAKSKEAEADVEVDADADADADAVNPGSPKASGKATEPKWIHMDVMAFNPSTRPGRPEGGEAQGLRAFYALLEKMYPPAKAG